jgi:hypothetical protein
MELRRELWEEGVTGGKNYGGNDGRRELQRDGGVTEGGNQGRRIAEGGRDRRKGLWREGVTEVGVTEEGGYGGMELPEDGSWGERLPEGGTYGEKTLREERDRGGRNCGRRK